MPRPARYKPVPKPVKASRVMLVLQDRIRAFILAYLKNGRNAGRAAREIGYNDKRAQFAAHRMMKRPEVLKAIKAHDEEQAAVVGLTVNRTLREVARIAYADPIKLFHEDGSLRHVRDMDPEMRGAIQSIEVERRNGRTIGKIKLYNKNDALEKAMRHMGLYNKDNEQRHDVFQTLIIDANRTLDGKFSKLIDGRAVKVSEESDG